MLFQGQEPFSHTEKLGNWIRSSAIQLYASFPTASFRFKWLQKKKALIRYLLNTQSSAEKGSFYIEAEGFISLPDLSQTPAFIFQVFKAKFLQRQE